MTRIPELRGRFVPLVSLTLLMVVASLGLHAQSENDRGATNESAQSEDRRAEEARKPSAEPRDGEETRTDSSKSIRRETAPKEATDPNVSPLVKAAAASKKKSTRSFTDADLATAKGKLIVVEGTNVREPEIIPIEERTPELAKTPKNDHSEQARAVQRRIAAKALRQEIAELERELDGVETDYYMIEEEDHREEMERGFDEKRKALEEKKKKLKELESGGAG